MLNFIYMTTTSNYGDRNDPGTFKRRASHCAGHIEQKLGNEINNAVQVPYVGRCIMDARV